MDGTKKEISQEAAREMMRALERIEAAAGMQPGHVSYLSKTEISNIARAALARAREE